MVATKQYETFDVSPTAREAIEYKDARRRKMRQSYLKQIHNPINQQLAMDDAMTRFRIMRQYQEHYAKANWRFFASGTGVIAGVIGFFYVLFSWGRKRKMGLIESGQVAYADRKMKFMN